MLKSLFSFIKEMVAIYFDRHISRSAAELAFFVTLTFFPLLICLNALTDLLNLSESPLLALFSGIIPESSLKILTDYLTYISTNYSMALLIGGLALMITSSSAAFRAMLNITGDIYGKPLFRPIPHLIVSVLSSIVMLVVLYGSILIMVTGEWFLNFFEVQFHLKLSILTIWPWLRFIILFGFLFVMLFCFYRVPLLRKKPHPPVVWGAVFASAALVGVSIFFSWMIGMSSRYELVYGSLAAIIILMLWLYLCGNIIILGSAFNFVYEKHWLRRRGQLTRADSSI